ncbi:TPA: restriction endonuclease subunit S [Klebsiella aerogenes]|uniref:restriction endonuclease subunit S n=1 Tax=Klebsiella TaxID=570 RepID=UPI002929DEA9|nr:restriction endonuclease subunit S [Klebsiella sp. 141203]MDU9366554.1 restriction endonuclease subunit S [Klebsiella sp. 141203]HEP0587946.1 restriction endonuclease subunit S [Klebsiella aerogenes]
MAVEKLIVDHIDTWTTALQTRSTAGRGSSGKIDLYGIKKLRELILELAVRGKLVPQDPNDEPASELLKRIAAEKAELVKQGKIKKQKPLPEISEEEKPFELPEGWEWVRLSDLMEVINGRAYKKHEMLQEGTPLLRVGNLFTSNEWYYSDLELDENKYIDNGDLLYAWSASFGPFIWTGKKVIYHYHIWKLKLFAEELSDKFFIHDFLLSITDKIKSQGNGIAMLHMTKERMEQQVIALPPVNEQKNIVQKIRELMSLCDQLEQHSLTSLDAHQQLVETLLTTLTGSQNADELAENWARISEHFDTLFTTEASIDALKQTILQLAVMGKLVPQDPNDEPASELLKRITQEKAQLVKDGKMKKQKPLPPISDKEKPFELPTGWSLAHFGDIAIEIATGPFGSMIHQSDYIIGGVPLINPSHIVNSKIVIDPAISVSTELAKSLSSYKMIAGNIVMARRGEMGRCAVVTTKENGYLCGTGSFILKFSDEIDKDYIVELFKTVYVRNYLGGNSVGSTMTNLNHSILNKMPIHLPPVRMQTKIVAAITSFSAYCENLKSKIKSAQQTQLHLADALTDAAIN